MASGNVAPMQAQKGRSAMVTNNPAPAWYAAESHPVWAVALRSTKWPQSNSHGTAVAPKAMMTSAAP